MPRFGEALLSVPVSISAFTALRQAWGLSTYTPRQGVPYVLRGKLPGGLLGTARFTDKGVLNWPEPAQAPLNPCPPTTHTRNWERATAGPQLAVSNVALIQRSQA